MVNEGGLRLPRPRNLPAVEPKCASSSAKREEARVGPQREEEGVGPERQDIGVGPEREEGRMLTPTSGLLRFVCSSSSSKMTA